MNENTEKKAIEELAQVLDKAKEDALATIGSLNRGWGTWYAEAVYAAGYRKQSAWISVDERLPDKGMPKDDGAVLGIVRGKYRNVEYHDAMELVCYFADEGVWALWSDASVTIQVTHWMPLPEPPKGAGNDKNNLCLF